MAGPQDSGSQEPAQGAGDSVQTAKATVKDVAQTARHEAASFAETAKDKVSDKVEAKTGEAGEALSDFAQAIRRAGEALSESDRGSASQMMSQAADGMEGLARTLSQKKPEELLETVREYGRDNPTALFAGSVLAGLALGRFLRASDRPRQDDAAQAAPQTGAEPPRVGDRGAGGAPRIQDDGGDLDHSPGDHSPGDHSPGGHSPPDHNPGGGAQADGAREVTEALGRDPRSGDEGASPVGRIEP